MRTKEQIRQAILQNLTTSANWQSLQHAVVGKELLAWATEAVYAQEAVAQTIQDTLDYNKATQESLISLCHINDVFTSFNQPSFVRCKLPNLSQEMVFPPFSIKATNGSASFYNISYCRSGDVVLLYQGAPVCYKTDGSPAITLTDNVESLPSSISINDSVCYPIDLIPDSLFVFCYSGSWHTVSSYSPVNYDANNPAYKIYTKEDAENVVMFGDGSWGGDPTSIYHSSQIAIVGLRPAYAKVSSPNYKFFIHNVETTNIEFYSFTDGVQNSLEYAKSYYRQRLLETTVIQSATQIKDYVKAYPYVLDCALGVTVADKTRVHIYIKPADITEAENNPTSNFGEIELALDLHGSILSNYHVTYGKPIRYDVHVHTSADIDQPTIDSITESVETHLGYNETPYDYRPSCSEIAAYIQVNHGLSTRVMFYIVENVKTYLSFIPSQGTLRFYNGDHEPRPNDAYIAWDSDGKIYSNSSESQYVPTFSLGLGRSLTNFTNCLSGLNHVFPVDVNGNVTPKHMLFSVDGIESGQAKVRELSLLSRNCSFSDAPFIINAEGLAEEVGGTIADNTDDADSASANWTTRQDLAAWIRSYNRVRRVDHLRQVTRTAASEGASENGFRTELIDQMQSVASAQRTIDNIPVDARVSVRSINLMGDGVRRQLYTAARVETVLDYRTSYRVNDDELVTSAVLSDIDKSIRLISTNGYAFFLVSNCSAADGTYDRAIYVFDKECFWNYPDVTFSYDNYLAKFIIPQDFPFDFAKPNFEADYLYESTPDSYVPLLIFHRNDNTADSHDASQLIWIVQEANGGVNLHYGSIPGNSGVLHEDFVYPLDVPNYSVPVGAFTKTNGLSEDLIVFFGLMGGTFSPTAVLVSDYLAPTINQTKLVIANYYAMRSTFDTTREKFINSIFRSFNNRLVISWRTRNLTGGVNYSKFLTSDDFIYSKESAQVAFANYNQQGILEAGFTDLSAIGTSPYRELDNGNYKTHYRYAPYNLYSCWGNASEEKFEGQLDMLSRDYTSLLSPDGFAIDILNSDRFPSWVFPLLVCDDVVVLGVVYYKGNATENNVIRELLRADLRSNSNLRAAANIVQNSRFAARNIRNSTQAVKISSAVQYNEQRVTTLRSNDPSQCKVLQAENITRNQFRPTYEVYRKVNGAWTLTVVNTYATSGDVNNFVDIAVVGSVSYYTGELRIPGISSDCYVSYEASSYANISNKYFFMLNSVTVE